MAANGTFCQTAITSLDVWSAGPNTFLHQTAAGSVTGTLSGTYQDDLTVVIHPNGRFNARFTITCQCTVGDTPHERDPLRLELHGADRLERVSQ
jgi:hypothetical protein